MQPKGHWARRMVVIAPRRRAGISERVLEAEAMLYDGQTGCTHRMNETALAIWRLCDGARTTHDIAAELETQYAVDADSALDDVEQTLAVFARAGLLEEAAE